MLDRSLIPKLFIRPEPKENLALVAGIQIALGIKDLGTAEFDDSDDPQVSVECGSLISWTNINTDDYSIPFFYVRDFADS